MEKTAVLWKTLRAGNFGNSRNVYELSEPILEPSSGKTSSYIMVSCLNTESHKETYAFLTDENGEWLSNQQLSCSLPWVVSDEKILKRAGYELLN